MNALGVFFGNFGLKELHPPTIIGTILCLTAVAIFLAMRKRRPR
jgi:hypothetical protein